MSATNAAETGFLALYFQNVDFANVGDAAGLQNSSAAGSLYVSLHTSDPGETGDQTTNEVTVGAYNTYARQAVSRAVGGAGWSISGTAPTLIENAAVINFPAMVSGTGATVTHFGIGSAVSGTGNLHFKGALTASRAISAGITPSFAAGDLEITCD